MSPQELLTRYRALPGTLELPAMGIARLAIGTHTLREPDAVVEALAQLPPVAGWACLQSRVIHWEAGTSGTAQPGSTATAADASDRARGIGERLRSAQTDGGGLLLSAEAIDDNGHSLHVRQDGRGGWRVIRFTPDAGDTYLTDQIALLRHRNDPGKRRNPGKLHYQRYWAVEPDSAHGVRQLAARFIGFAAPAPANGETR